MFPQSMEMNYENGTTGMGTTNFAQNVTARAGRNRDHLDQSSAQGLATSRRWPKSIHPGPVKPLKLLSRTPIHKCGARRQTMRATR
jgi:hypothetical protein